MAVYTDEYYSYWLVHGILPVSHLETDYLIVQVRDKTLTSYGDIPDVFEIDGTAYIVGDISNCFNGCHNLVTAPALPEYAEMARYCYASCWSLTTVGNFPTNIADMTDCFFACGSLTTVGSLPYSCTTMYDTFAYCDSLEVAPIIPDGVTDMSYCFRECTSLKGFHNNLPIPASVTNMTETFRNCTALGSGTYNIQVKNNPTSYDNVFAGTSSHMFIIPRNLGDTAVATWRSIAAQYGNVHYKYDDTVLRLDNMTIKRVASAGSTTESDAPTASHAYVIASITKGGYIPNGDTQSLTYTMKKNGVVVSPEQGWSSYSTELVAQVVVSEDPGTTTGERKKAWFAAETSSKTEYELVITDNFGNTTSLKMTLPKIGALLEAYHGNDGEGITIGTIAEHAGFNVAMDSYSYGERDYPMFTRSSWDASSSISSLPTTPCYILSESDLSLWYCDGLVSSPISSSGANLPGVIYPFSGTTVPDGFLLCDGSAVSRTTYAELFQVIGTTYGSGDGSTTFNVPDLRGRTAIGASSGHAMGSTGGSESHTHDYGMTYAGFYADTVLEGSNYVGLHNHNQDNTWSITGGGSDSGGHSINANGGNTSSTRSIDSAAHYSMRANTSYSSNMQPFATVNYIISTGQGGGVSVEEVIQGITTFPLDVQYGGTGASTAAGAPWVQKSGDTMTGTLRAPIYESKTQLPSIYGGAPSSTSYSPISSAQDASNDTFWYSEGYHGSDDYTGYNTVAYRRVSGSDVYLNLLMAIGPTGWRHAELSADNFIIAGRTQVNGDFEVRNLIDFHGGDNWSADYTTRLLAPRDDGEILLQAANGIPRFVAYRGGNANLYSAMFADSEGGKFQWIAPDGSENVIDSWNSSQSRIYNFYQGNYHAVYWSRNQDINLDLVNYTLHGSHYNGYYGLVLPDGGTADWFRTTLNGIIPYAAGGCSALGTSSWPFNSVHAQDIYISSGTYAALRTMNTGDRLNYLNRANDYLHISTWNYGNYGVTWWSSDIRLKENIEDSEVDALELVNQIQHRSFDMKGEHHDIGYIAQELEELDPQMVTKVYQTREVNGVSYFTGDYQYQVDERKVIPYLSRSIQQLSEENDELRAKNAELESRLAAIEERLGL